MTAALLTLQKLYAPIRHELSAAERIFDAELRSELPFINELCATVRSYRGKMLRPALLLLSGRATGELNPGHPTLAAVVEMVHMATLVHDDVLDGADLRRKLPTIAATDGNTAAVLLGDYLISHAFHLCSGLDDQFAARRIGATTNVVCEGELMQNRRMGDFTLTENEYFEIIRRKTGALTGVACELGAKFARADDATVAAMKEYGENAGIAFQIMDDCLDLGGDAQVVGKTLGRDLAQGKTTLPLIHALAQAGGPDGEYLREVLEDGGPLDVAKVSDILRKAQSVEYSIGAARQFVAEALACLERAEPGEARESLTALAEFVIIRNY